MTEDYDPLERELAGLQPREVSSSLHQQIADRLAESRPWRPGRTRRIAAAGAVLAACVAALLLIRVDWSAKPDAAGPRPLDDGIAAVPGPSPESADALPTLLVYSRALAQSPDELEALLDRHSRLGRHGRLGSQPGSEETPPFAFARPVDHLHPLSGEL